LKRPESSISHGVAFRKIELPFDHACNDETALRPALAAGAEPA